MLVSGNDFYCGNSSSNPSQLALKSQIPDVSGYAKSSDLESLKTSVSSGKSLVATAVTDKGVNTAADASFQTIANNVRSIPTGIGSGVATVMVSGSQNINAGDTVYLGAGLTWDDTNYTSCVGVYNNGIYVVSKYSMYIYGWCEGKQTFVRQTITNVNWETSGGLQNMKSYSDSSFSFECKSYYSGEWVRSSIYRINQSTGELEIFSDTSGSEISNSGTGTVSKLLTSSGDGISASYVGWGDKLLPAITYAESYSKYYKTSLYGVEVIGNPNAIMLYMPHYNAIISYIIPFIPDSIGYPCPYYAYKSLDEIPHHWSTSSYDRPYRYFVPFYGTALSGGAPGTKIQVKNYGSMTYCPWGR